MYFSKRTTVLSYKNGQRNILNNVCKWCVVMFTINKHAGNITGERSFIVINCTQTSSSVHSPALLFKSTSAFFRTMFEKRLPIPLMAVMANMTLRLPSMFVLRIRKMCWNFSGMTKDWKTRWIDQKIVFVQ